MPRGWLATVRQLPSISGLLAVATPSPIAYRPHRHHRDELLLATICEHRLRSHELGLLSLPSNMRACRKSLPDC